MASPTTQVERLVHQIEGALAHKFSGALSPRPQVAREKAATGIAAIDDLLRGGVPIGGLSEFIGAESSGRTTIAIALLASITAQDTAAAWVDVSDTFDPESAAPCGVDLRRLLWVRCADRTEVAVLKDESPSLMEDGAREASQAAPRGSGSPHPRSEAHGMSEAVASLLQTQPRSAAGKDRRARRIIGTPGAPNRPLMPFPSASPYREEQIPTDRMPTRHAVAETKAQTASSKAVRSRPALPPQPAHFSPKDNWRAMDRALRATDLLLQAGGFSLLVVDLSSVAAEMVWRIPLSTWFRFRAACERTRTTLVLLTQHPCAKSSADAVLRLHSGTMQRENGVLTGVTFAAEVERECSRDVSRGNVISMRKPPQRERDGQWSSRTACAVPG